jgi:hypothetical protein
MNLMFGYGLCALATAAFSLTTLLRNADTLDTANPFTQHRLPVPGAYFKNKESTQQSVVVAAAPAKSAANRNPTASKPRKSKLSTSITPPVRTV